MRWPWSKNEKRQSGGAYTDAIVAAIVAQASGNSVGEPGALAALEIASGLWSRGPLPLRSCPRRSRLSLHQFLASIVARQLVRTGQSLWAIDVLHGEIEFLRPAGSWDVAGGSSESTWVYRLDLFGPSATETRVYPSCKSCLPFSNMRRTRNGRGARISSPLGYARATSRLAGNLELRLAEEANAKVGYLLPVPSDGGDGSASDPLAMLKSDLAALAGSVALIETTSAGFGEGRAAAPLADWKPQRMGANPPATLAELRGAAAEDILSACGVPPGLASGTAEGTSQRESWRRFGITMQSVGRGVAEELSDKLDLPGLSLTFESIGSADMSGKSRAVGALVKAGVKLPRALQMVGLTERVI